MEMWQEQSLFNTSGRAVEGRPLWYVSKHGPRTKCEEAGSGKDLYQ